jgi:hypothetical protein
MYRIEYDQIPVEETDDEFETLSEVAEFAKEYLYGTYHSLMDFEELCDELGTNGYYLVEY